MFGGGGGEGFQTPRDDKYPENGDNLAEGQSGRLTHQGCWSVGTRGDGGELGKGKDTSLPGQLSGFCL